VIHFQELEDAVLVPQRQAILPPPHHEVLNLLARDKDEQWTIPKPVMNLAEEVFAKVGIELRRQT
jgi:hypothetical protein